MTIKTINFKGQQVSLGDTVKAKLVSTHIWAGDFKDNVVTFVVDGMDKSGAIGGHTETTDGETVGWPAYVALADDGDLTFECTLISVTKPTTKE